MILIIYVMSDKMNCNCRSAAEAVYLLSRGQYYRDVLLMQELLPAIHSLACMDVFVFQQDNAPAHRARDTVELLRCETSQFISPDMWGQPTVET